MFLMNPSVIQQQTDLQFDGYDAGLDFLCVFCSNEVFCIVVEKGCTIQTCQWVEGLSLNGTKWVSKDICRNGSKGYVEV